MCPCVLFQSHPSHLPLPTAPFQQHLTSFMFLKSSCPLESYICLQAHSLSLGDTLSASTAFPSVHTCPFHLLNTLHWINCLYFVFSQ